MTDLIYRFDYAILDFLNDTLPNPVLDVLFSIITFLGDAGWFWIALTVAFLCFRKTRAYGIGMALSLIFSALVTNLTLKPLINRSRPYALKEVELRIDPPHDASFPSGHTSASFAAAFVLFGQNKKLGIPALVLASLIAFSRLYFYLHFFTDILGGFLVGFLAALASLALLPYCTRGLAALLKKFSSKGGN